MTLNPRLITKRLIERLAGDIRNDADLLDYAATMEAEAAARYRELADQLEIHHNTEVAAVFRKMAEIEELHGLELRSRGSHRRASKRAVWDYNWVDPEGPETLPVEVIDAGMSVRKALELAHFNEQRAQHFYELLAANGKTEKVRKLAREYAEEEREHVRLMENWLAEVPATDPNEDEDQEADPAIGH